MATIFLKKLSYLDMTIRIYLCPIKEKQKLVRAAGFGMEQQENI